MKTQALMITLLLFANPVYADKCKSTEYKLVDRTVSFGDTSKVALKSAKKAFRKRGASFDENDTMIFVMFPKPYKNLGSIAYVKSSGRVTRIIFSYSKAFQARFGGLVDTLTVLLKKLVGKHGKAKNVDVKEEKGRVEADWAESNGASLHVIAQDPNGLVIRIDCDELERDLRQKAAKTENFGF